MSKRNKQAPRRNQKVDLKTAPIAARPPTNLNSPGPELPSPPAQKPEPTTAAAPPRWLPWAISGLLALLVAIVYGQTGAFHFISLDDEDLVYGNPHVLGGLTWANISWAWTTPHTGNWTPPAWLSLMLDAELYGSQAGGYHITSAILHAAAAITLFLALWRLTGDMWPSAFVAGLFAVHPLHVESVAWVSERRDVLSGLFFALTLLAYERYARRPFAWGRYLLVFALLAVGLMAKPMLVTVPCLMLLLDYWPLRRLGDATERRRALVEKLPLFALIVAASIVTMKTQTIAMSTAEILPYSQRLENATAAYGAYLGDAIFPSQLSVFYPYPKNRLPVGSLLLRVAVLVAASMGAWLVRQRHPYVLVGWFWYVGTLVPVIGIIQVGSQARADRYMYLPLIGLGIAAAWSVIPLVRRWAIGPLAGFSAGVLYLLILTAASFNQASLWRNTETLFKHAVECTPRSAVTRRILGNELNRQGRSDEAIVHYREAIAEEPDDVISLTRITETLLRREMAEEALPLLEHLEGIQPESAIVLNNKGNALLLLKRNDEAETAFRRAVELKPNFAEPHINLGSILHAHGKSEEAAEQFRLAIETRPKWPEAHNNLGGVLLAQKRPRAAEEQFRLALQIDPACLSALMNYSRLCIAEGRDGEAIDLLKRSLKAASSPDGICEQLVEILLRQNRLDEAINVCRLATERFPADAASQNNLAGLLIRRERTDEAIFHYQRAIELEPRHDVAHFNLGAIYHQQGKLDLAAAHYRKALDANPQNKDAQNNLTIIMQQRRGM